VHFALKSTTLLICIVTFLGKSIQACTNAV
jgi:hypothetical protein